MKPFLKWPGGKRWFVANYQQVLPQEFNTYFEPFYTCKEFVRNDDIFVGEGLAPPVFL